MNIRQLFGKKNETLAIACLKKKGYRIIDKNVRNTLGEIDIIASLNETIVFVEVKSRSSLAFGSPKTAVNRNKQRRISKVALLWMKKNNLLGTSARFDVVSIVSTTLKTEIEIVKNAFDLQY